MSTILKFAGGLVLGVAIGAGVYLLVTKDGEDGVIHGIKKSINRAVEEGKRSAEERRKQLEQELGFSVSSETPASTADAMAVQVTPPQAIQ